MTMAEPQSDPRKQLAGRLVALGLIPIAVFCAAFMFTRAALGTALSAQAWTFVVALLARCRMSWNCAPAPGPLASR